MSNLYESRIMSPPSGFLEKKEEHLGKNGHWTFPLGFKQTIPCMRYLSEIFRFLFLLQLFPFVAKKKTQRGNASRSADLVDLVSDQRWRKRSALSGSKDTACCRDVAVAQWTLVGTRWGKGGGSFGFGIFKAVPRQFGGGASWLNISLSGTKKVMNLQFFSETSQMLRCRIWRQDDFFLSVFG